MTRTSETTQKGILLDSGGGSGYVLTPDGRFAKVNCQPDAEEGREISFESRLQPEWRRWMVPTLRPALRPAWALALTACLVVAMLMPFAVGRALASGDPVAFVTFDINPSIEFGVNRWDRVVSATSLNEDGTAILAEIDWEGRPVDEVLLASTTAAGELGYLEPVEGGDIAVVVAAVPAGPGQGLPPGLEKRVERARETMTALVGETAPGATVESVLGDSSSLREEAQALGLSVGAYSVLLVAQERGLDMDLDDLERGLGRAILDAGGHPGEVMQEAHQHRTLSKLAEKFQERNGLGNRGGDDDDGDASQPGQGAADGAGRGQDSGGNPGRGQGGRGAGGNPGDGARDDRGSDGGRDGAGPGSHGDAGDNGSADDQGPDDTDDQDGDDEGAGDSGENEGGQG